MWKLQIYIIKKLERRKGGGAKAQSTVLEVEAVRHILDIDAAFPAEGCLERAVLEARKNPFKAFDFVGRVLVDNIHNAAIRLVEPQRDLDEIADSDVHPSVSVPHVAAYMTHAFDKGAHSVKAGQLEPAVP